MEWNRDLCVQLIDEYEKWPILWNQRHPCHFSRKLKVDAWKTIATNLKINVADVKQKMNSLLGSLRREKSKGKKTIRTGKVTSEVYVSKWYAFKRMYFLLDKDEPVATLNTELEEREDQNSEVSAVHSKINKQKGQRYVPPDTQKQKKCKFNKNDDAKLEEALRILKQSVAVPPVDACATYGAHVGNKIRNYSQQVRVQVEHAINNILYHADMGKYNTSNPSPNDIFTS